MKQIWVNQGLLDSLHDIVANDVVYHLFTNDVAVSRTTNLGDLIEMGGGSGYLPITVPAGDWGDGFVRNNIGQLLAPPIVWTPAGGAWDIWGYYATTPGAAGLRFVAKFDDGPEHIPDGEPFILVPLISDFSQQT